MELNERLEKNYLNEIKEYLEYLKSKGYVIYTKRDSENREVYKYHVRKSRFVKAFELFELPHYVLKNVPNHYSIDIINTIKNMALDILPTLENNAYSDYLSYVKASENIGDDKELKEQLKNLKKEIKNNQLQDNKNINDVVTQAYYLNKNKVVFVNVRDFKQGYYVYKNKNFIKLNDDSIRSILINEFKTHSNNLNKLQLNKYMRDDYKELLVNSTLPISWNAHQKSLNVLDSRKKGYEQVKKITDNFI